MPKTVSGHDAIRTIASPYLRAAKIPGTKITLRTRRSYLPLFLRLGYLLDKIHPLDQRGVGSYNYRAPRAGSGISDHAGYAADFWSDSIGAHVWPSAMKAATAREISKVLETFKTPKGEHIFGWGACNQAAGVVYTGPTYSQKVNNDPMHFFIAPNVTVADAEAAIKAMRINPDGTIAK